MKKGGRGGVPRATSQAACHKAVPVTGQTGDYNLDDLLGKRMRVTQGFLPGKHPKFCAKSG